MSHNINSIQTLSFNQDKNRFSGSLINFFEEERMKRADSNVSTVESVNMANIAETHDDFNDLMSKMSKDEYLRTIFGPSLYAPSLKNLTIREKIKRVLNSNYVHIAVIVLVLLDSLCVAVELIVDKEKQDNVEVVDAIFKYFGFSILCIFVVEISLKILVAFHEFIRSKLEIFDAIIVYISFSIDAAFLTSDDGISALVAVLVILRFWRIIRIVNGIIMTVEKRAEAKIEKLKLGMNALIRENENIKLEIGKKDALLNAIRIVYDFK